MENIEKIKCAAIKLNDEIIEGKNHSVCIKIAIKERGWKKPVFTNLQGFMTSKGRYVDRREAAKIAFKAGQIPKTKDILFSEDYRNL